MCRPLAANIFQLHLKTFVRRQVDGTPKPDAFCHPEGTCEFKDSVLNLILKSNYLFIINLRRTNRTLVYYPQKNY